MTLVVKYKPDIYANSAEISVSVDCEIVSETEDETQPPLLVMPTLTADDLLEAARSLGEGAEERPRRWRWLGI